MPVILLVAVLAVELVRQDHLYLMVVPFVAEGILNIM
jgi:hypothetical protein